ncbi:cupin domain-containing protein [Pedobacter sp. HMF7647]|uniref:Cupin domain-containing protein n=1 Tax=Hufsiella arboris TaxID=2695275 RepID=A0A7K1YEN6_9SPHI|nr:cupin domain-containing protein [Hufsiella arboris]MXV53073.1 cupin domain-containing protein [Hufsiella arboris]
MKQNQTIILRAGQGRSYKLGAMTAIFKADEKETDEKYSVSEWWLEPNSNGPGPHQHDDQDQIFYVLEGTMSILVADNWIDADKGTFVRIPTNTIHTFANRTDKKAGMLNLDVPGGFEKNMPSMVKWFEENE